MYLQSLRMSTISDNTIINTGKETAYTYSGIYLGGTETYHVTYCLFHGNRIWVADLEAAYDNCAMKAGIEFGNSYPDYNVFEFNDIWDLSHEVAWGYINTAIIPNGTNNKYFKNRGYISEKTSTATISSGQSSVVVTHGMGGNNQKATPTKITATGSTADTSALYVDTTGNTYFTIHAAGAVGGNRTVYWYAEV